MAMLSIPYIRFNKFDNEWFSKKLNHVSKVTMGQSPDSKNYTDNPNDYILVQGNADMQNGRVVPRVWTTQVTKLAEKGDLILSVRAPVGDIGKTDYNVVLGRGVAAIKGNEFLFQLLTKMKQSHYWSKFSTGSTFESINSNDIKSAEIYLPSIEEQSAIGSLFRTLDDLLASYKDNLANYQSLKTTMLSKMFPKAGQTVPEIRLDGFEGEWEKYYLGDIFEQVSNYIEPSKENELWSLTVEKGLTPKTDRYKRDFLVKKNDKFKKVDVQEFVYNPMNLTLGALDLNDNEVTISVSGYYVVMKNRNMEKFDNDFLKILLKTTYAIYQYKQFATGTLIEKQRVQFPTFSEIPIYLPPIAEQQAIGTYFSNLANLINSHQEKISQLETLKKKLLQDMFI